MGLSTDLVSENGRGQVIGPAASFANDVSAASDDKVSISGIWKAYATGNGSTAAVEDVNLQIPRGQFVTLIGPSGCGAPVARSVCLPDAAD